MTLFSFGPFDFPSGPFILSLKFVFIVTSPPLSPTFLLLVAKHMSLEGKQECLGRQ